MYDLGLFFGFLSFIFVMQLFLGIYLLVKGIIFLNNDIYDIKGKVIEFKPRARSINYGVLDRVYPVVEFIHPITEKKVQHLMRETFHDVNEVNYEILIFVSVDKTNKLDVLINKNMETIIKPSILIITALALLILFEVIPY